MENEKVVVEVPNTGINDYHLIEIFGGLLIISGIGVVVYVKKEKSNNKKGKKSQLLIVGSLLILIGVSVIE